MPVPAVHLNRAMRVNDLAVGAVMYVVSDGTVDALFSVNGVRREYRVGTIPHLLPLIDALRLELHNTMAVARGRVPTLHAFSRQWGRKLLPPELLQSPPPVIVFVPHAFLHDVPLHLISTDDDQLLGVRAAVSYASSQTLFVRCVSRNRARQRDPAAWLLDGRQRRSDARIVAGGVDVLHENQQDFHSIIRSVAKNWPQTEVIAGPGHSQPYGRLEAKRHLRVASAAPSPSAVIMVAHGYIDEADHRYSGLLVDQGSGVLNRGIQLFGREYLFRDLALCEVPAWVQPIRPTEILTTAELEIDAEASCELIMLLGCSAGWGRELQGDEPASIAEQFLHAGAPSVIAPLWDSDVDTTAAWCGLFIEAWLAKDQPKALAARDALGGLLSQGCPMERAGVLTLRGDWL